MYAAGRGGGPHASLKALSVLELSANPLPSGWIDLSKTARLDDFRRMVSQVQGSSEHFEAKVILVGRGRVGKTCLLDASRGRVPRQNQSSTEGIDIERIPIVGTHQGRPVTLNFWDFGGQSKYEITHQFFFTPDTVYLVLWEPRTGPEAVEAWLELIHQRVGPSARVILVKSHAVSDDRSIDLPRQDLLERYGSMISGFFEVDTFVEDSRGNRHGVNALLARIAELACSWPHSMPPDWIDARTAIRELADSWITIDEFRRITRSRGLDDGDSATLLRLMNIHGHVVSYDWTPSDLEGTRAILDEIVVLRPEDLAKAIGFVLTDPAVNQNRGVLEHTELARIWAARQDPPVFPREIHVDLVRLMERYDVCHRLRDHHGRFVPRSLVPQLLGAVQEPANLPWSPGQQSDGIATEVNVVVSPQSELRGLFTLGNSSAPSLLA